MSTIFIFFSRFILKQCGETLPKVPHVAYKYETIHLQGLQFLKCFVSCIQYNFVFMKPPHISSIYFW
jgi:hypothetical protein